MTVILDRDSCDLHIELEALLCAASWRSLTTLTSPNLYSLVTSCMLIPFWVIAGAGTHDMTGEMFNVATANS